MQVSLTIRLEKSLSREEEKKKKNAMRLVYCNFFSYSLDCNSEDRFRLEQSDGFQLISNSCLMQYHDNVKFSTRDREEYTGHEKL